MGRAYSPRRAAVGRRAGLWILLVIVGITATLAGGSPQIQVGTVTLGLGGLLDFLRFTALSIVLLGMGALVSWTTNVAEIAPAVATLGRRLRPLRIPVDDWSVALALALRTFPMLIDEFRVLYAARRLRPKQTPRTRRARRQATGSRRDRPDRRGHHRDTAARGRDGRCDHRPRRHRSDLGGPVAAETG